MTTYVARNIHHSNRYNPNPYRSPFGAYVVQSRGPLFFNDASASLPGVLSSPLLSLLSSSLYDHIRTPPPRIPRPRIPRPSKHAHERREREDDEQHPAGDPHLSLRDAFAEGRSIRANVGVEFIGVSWS
jgi:hypothetical protein